MPYASNNGVRIHYKVEGTGPPHALKHGSFGSEEDWFDLGYVGPQQHNHRLILIDARGHWTSDKPHDSCDYEIPLRFADVTAVLDDLEIHRGDFFGYSMGGWIGSSDVLATMAMPCLLFAGEADPRLPPVRTCAESIRQAAFIALPECGHVAPLGRSDLVLPHVGAFFAQPRG